MGGVRSAHAVAEMVAYVAGKRMHLMRLMGTFVGMH